MIADDAEPEAEHVNAGLLATAVAWVAHGILLLTAAFSVVAVPLAMGGWFRSYLLFPLTLAVALGLYWLDRSRPFRIVARTGPTAVVLVAVGLFTVLGLVHPTQHFSTNRDPGIYSSTALWLEREGSVLFDPMAQEFEGLDGVSSVGGGFYDTREDGRIQPQFAHLTHTMLGGAAMVGGEPLLTRANVLVASAAMLMLFLLIQQFAPGWAAAAAVVTVASSLPQIYFSRGPYSEPLAQLLLVGALCIIASRSRLSVGHALLAGLLLGAVMGSRIDAVLLLPALIIIICAWVLTAERSEWPSPLALVTGALTTALIGLIDLRFFSTPYLNDLWPRFRLALLLAGATALAGALGVALVRRLPLVVTKVHAYRSSIGIGLALATWFAGVLVLFVRPLSPAHREAEFGLIGGLQARQGFEVEPTRTYAEQSAEWLAWYLGWPLVIAALFGACVLVHRLTVRWSWAQFSVLVLLAVPTAVYLARPSITPDQIWAMRRFLPTAFPLVALLAAIGAASAFNALARPGVVPRRAGALAASLLLVVPAAVVAQPYWTFREFRLDTAGLSALCDAADGRAVMVDNDRNQASSLIQPIAAACGTPTAGLSVDHRHNATEIATRFEQGAVLVSVVDTLAEELDGLRLEQQVIYRVEEMERSVERPPTGSEPPGPRTVTLSVYELTG